MKQKHLWLMCGAPGSGKSTWAKHKLKLNDIWISRDQIRFHLLKEGEDYFSHENEVIDLFIRSIQANLNNGIGENIYVDATHLNRKSRKNLLNKLNLENTEINCVYFNIPLEEVLKRNDKRTGLEKVPSSVVKRMYYSIEFPTFEEGFNKIIEVDEFNNEKEIKRKDVLN